MLLLLLPCGLHDNSVLHLLLRRRRPVASRQSMMLLLPVCLMPPPHTHYVSGIIVNRRGHLKRRAFDRKHLSCDGHSVS
jgi:hypothetical protein